MCVDTAARGPFSVGGWVEGLREQHHCEQGSHSERKCVLKQTPKRLSHAFLMPGTT